MAKLKQIVEKDSKWAGQNSNVGVKTELGGGCTRGAENSETGGHPLPLRPLRGDAHRRTSYDDFGEMEWYATVLIDAQCLVHWASIGGEPLTGLASLANQRGPTP